MSSIAAMWSPLLFGFALFLSSALLFLVQPMIGRTLLPHLGGSTLAWNACLVFFQATLLAGYVYADLLHRFRGLRWQPWLQLLFLAAATFLCFAGVFGEQMLNNVAPRFTSLDSAPLFSTICLLVLVIGAPYLALAAVGPLVQRWFAHLDHPKASDPYFLFVASNLGGLTALIFYPAFIEPHAPMYAQWMSWKLAVTALGFLLFLVAICAWASPRNPEMEPPAKPTDPNAPALPMLIGRGPATWPRRLFWLAASALPVGLMMGVTDYLTLDVAPTPMLWVLPLALYLLAFSQAFARFSPLDHGGFVLKLLMHLALGLFVVVALLIIVITLMTERRGMGDESPLAVFVGMCFLLVLVAPQSWFAVLQPISVVVIVVEQANVFAGFAFGMTPVALHLFCFYASARLCLGALADNRPAATALTTYFNWIGIGGLVGGLFQLVIAPILFRHAFLEYSLLAALASTMRPAWTPNGLTDWAVCTMFFPKRDANDKTTPPSWRRLGIGGDFALAFLVAVIAGGLFYFCRGLVKAPGGPNRLVALLADFPLMLAILTAAVLYLRPLRFGLAFAGVVLLSMIGSAAANRNDEKLLVRQRSPYGILRVTERVNDIPNFAGEFRDPKAPRKFTERMLMHATTHHGSCITDPPDLRRYPTTYYHEYGPVGRVMLSSAWFTPLNANPAEWRPHHGNYLANDARIAASLIGTGAAPLGNSPLPMESLTNLWTEPPYAIVGMGPGVQYAYAHPYQWVDAYELDPAMVALSLKVPSEYEGDKQRAATSGIRTITFAPASLRGGEGPAPIFHYAQDAQTRGVQGQVFIGDARRSLSKRGHEGFYQMIFIDVFNSDAIPTHLLTEEAIALYFQKLAPEGIICIHTSNRHVDLVQVLERVTQRLDVPMRVSRLNPDNREMAPVQFSSEWVLITRTHETMNRWFARGGLDRINDGKDFFRDDPFNRQFGRRSNTVWTDDHASPMSAVRGGAGWSTLVYTLLVVIFIFAMIQGIIEIIAAMATPTRRAPPSAAKTTTKPNA